MAKKGLKYRQPLMLKAKCAKYSKKEDEGIGQ